MTLVSDENAEEFVRLARTAASRCTRQHHDADDVAQELVLAALKKKKTSGTQVLDLPAWVSTVGRTFARKARRAGLFLVEELDALPHGSSLGALKRAKAALNAERRGQVLAAKDIWWPQLSSAQRQTTETLLDGRVERRSSGKVARLAAKIRPALAARNGT